MGPMPLKVSNIRLPVEEPETALADAIARRVGMKSDELTRWRILRKSLDARSPRDLQFVYSAVVDVPDEPQRFAQFEPGRAADDVQWFSPQCFHEPDPGREPLPERPVVIGSGPAGL